MSNRLLHETSPYLLQHATNPVDWFPWGAEAFRAARELDRPILLSIGYSACHWCHVMARESFADSQTAALMNRLFVNVKVDREERPEVDQVYMQALQALTGAGGWPLTAFLTPDGAPFFAGTYFPPVDRPGQPAFQRVLLALAEAWADQRDAVLTSGADLLEHLERSSASLIANENPLSGAIPDLALTTLSRQADPQHGGFGGAPKFPHASALAFLLGRPEPAARDLALDTLQQMARGGIFDQLGGGFARYTVDAAWLQPHFEKMLFDNAQLLPLYAAAWALTGEAAYARTAGLTADWLQRDLLAPEGAFYSALSAESEGSEGRYYLWDHGSFDQAAGADATLACDWFSVTAAGNLEGSTVLTVPPGSHTLFNGEETSFGGHSGTQLRERLETIRLRLLAVRSNRVPPDLDTKILTSWNGLAISGLSDTARLLDRPDLLQLARGAAEFLLHELYDGGQLQHVWSGGQARIAGLLEDYAFLGNGLLALYRATLERRWLQVALQLAAVIANDFTDDAGTLFSTARHAEALVLRPRSVSDSGAPADTAAAATLLLRLGRLTENPRWLELAEKALQDAAPFSAQQPALVGTALSALELWRRPQVEVVLAGPAADPQIARLARIVQARHLPHAELLHTTGADDPLVQDLPLLAGRNPVAGQAAAYVCSGGTCRLPVSSPQALLESVQQVLRAT